MIGKPNPPTHYDQLCESLGEPIATAVQLCALPHWFDDDLAYGILDRFVNLNGDAQSVLAELKRLPFVYPYEIGGWRFASSARAHFASRLAAQNHTYLELSSFLTDYFGRVRAKVLVPDSPEAREAEWRIAYHLAPVDAKAAVECLHRLNKQAVERYRLADMRAVVDLANEQSRWLSTYAVDSLYFAGHYAYARGDFKLAEAHFTAVWKQAEPSKMKAIAGHLLGVIWMRTKQAHNWVFKASDMFQRSLELERQLGDTHGQAMVLNSLGGALVKLGGRKRLQDAQDAFERSLKLLEQLGDTRGQAMVLVSLSVWAETAGNNPQACSYMEQAILLFGGLGLLRNVQTSQRRLQRLRETP